MPTDIRYCLRRRVLTSCQENSRTNRLNDEPESFFWIRNEAKKIAQSASTRNKVDTLEIKFGILVKYSLQCGLEDMFCEPSSVLIAEIRTTVFRKPA